MSECHSVTVSTHMGERTAVNVRYGHACMMGKLTFRRQVVHDTSDTAQHEHARQRHFSGQSFHYHPVQKTSRDLDQRNQRKVQELVAGEVGGVYRQPVVHQRYGHPARRTNTRC